MRTSDPGAVVWGDRVVPQYDEDGHVVPKMDACTGPRPYRARVTSVLLKPSRVDLALTATLLTLGQLTTWLQLDSPDAFAGSRWTNAVVVALGTLPLLLRRSAPTAVVVISATVLCLPHVLADLDVTVLGQFLPLIVVTASCGYHARASRSVGGAAFAAASMLALSWTTPFLRTPTSLVFNTVVLLAPWAAARALRHREDRARRLGAALEHERAQFERRTAEAVDRQRAEIARDLHDVVAHGVSVMVLQIGGARMQMDDDRERAARSLLQAEDAGREALADLRRMLGVLRSAPQPTATADAHPRPGLHQLDALVQQARRAAVEVELCLHGDVDALPPAVDVSAYRIAQEAMTNVLKHSGARRARLRVEIGDRMLFMTVHDDGSARQDSDRQGYGLIGIRERVAFLGGRTRIGPVTSGGWEVAVEIPLAAAASSPGLVTQKTPT